MVAAGRLSERITIQEKSVTRDAYGAEVISWSDVATVWGEAAPVRGQEYVALRAAQADITTKFTIRYLSGITQAMRVVWDGDNYNIIDVINPRGRNVTLELMATAETVAS